MGGAGNVFKVGGNPGDGSVVLEKAGGKAPPLGTLPFPPTPPSSPRKIENGIRLAE